MKAILGLGNPGLRFKFSRHNLGFLVVERLAKKKKIRINHKAFHCLGAKARIGNQQVLLLKPLTYVNLSGLAASLVVKKNKRLSLKDLLVICDDINLPLGKIRMRLCGSDGGHKGLRSIIEALDSKDFARLRIGVGTAQAKSKNQLSNYVLGNFNKSEIKIINTAIEKAVSASIVWVTEGINAAMNRFNRKGD